MNRTVTYRILNGRRKDKARLEAALTSCRHLYNAALQQRKEAWNKQRKSLSFFDQCKELTDLRGDNEEYRDLNLHMVRLTVLKRLDLAFKSFFRRIKSGEKPGFPRFKGKDRFDTLVFANTGWKLKSNKLTLKNIGWFRVRGSNKYPTATPIGLRIVKKADRLYAQVLLKLNNVVNQKQSTNGVGIDVGLKTFATLSDGVKIEHPKFLTSSLNELKQANQRLARRKKGSSRRKEAKRLLGRTYLRIANRRKDFVHKVTRSLINNYDGFAVEGLNVQQMSRGLKTLRRGIMDSGWSMFFSTLAYKAEEAGMPIVSINPKGTTQSCSRCGTLVRKSLGDRWHSCGACGLEMDRDENAAINILNGAVRACGFAPRGPVDV